MRFFLILLFLLSLKSNAAWIVELPMDRCAGPLSQNQKTLCIASGIRGAVKEIEVIEIGMENGEFHKRVVSSFQDTSKLCDRKDLGTIDFHAFESRDVDSDGILDQVLLFRAGKSKRKLSDPCPSPQIPTALYELSYSKKNGEFELTPPSVLVFGRFKTMNLISIRD